MAIQTRDILKGWFETNDKPTQQQFWDWLDSFIHKSEDIEIEDVAGLVDALNAKADKVALDAVIKRLYPFKLVLNANGSFLLADTYEVYHIKIKPSVESLIKIGLAADTDDVALEADMPANQYYGCDCSVVADGVTKEIFFTGIAASTTILFYLRTLQFSNL